MRIKFFKKGWLLFVLMVVSVIYVNAQTDECSLNLHANTMVYIDLFACVADTLEEEVFIYSVDTADINGQIVYGELGCPACDGCGCINGFIGKDTLYVISDLATIQENDSIDFGNSSQVSQWYNDYSMEQNEAFVYKNGSDISVCWVENYDYTDPDYDSDPQSGVLRCIYRKDGINYFDLSSVDPGEHPMAAPDFARPRMNVKRNDTSCYDLLGRMQKKK